jgi:hypothetical protein
MERDFHKDESKTGMSLLYTSSNNVSVVNFLKFME